MTDRYQAMLIADAELLRKALKHALLAIDTLMKADIPISMLAVPREAKQRAESALLQTSEHSLDKLRTAAWLELRPMAKLDYDAGWVISWRDLKVKAWRLDPSSITEAELDAEP